MLERPIDTDTHTATIRLMTEQDLPAMLAVQAACYPPAMQEPAAIVLARLRAASGTTLVADGADGVCAYVFAYPSRLGAVTPLGARFAPAPDADTLYIHDLAVAPSALGQGLARGCSPACPKGRGRWRCRMRHWWRCRTRAASGRGRASRCGTPGRTLPQRSRPIRMARCT